MAKRYWFRKDPDYKQPEELFAKQLLWQSGLTREETNELFKKSWRMFKDNDRYEEQIIREQLLDMFAHVKDMDLSRVMHAQKHRKHHFPTGKLSTLYVEHRPEIGQEGTDLKPEDVYELNANQQYDIKDGFDPLNPVLAIDDEYDEKSEVEDEGVLDEDGNYVYSDEDDEEYEEDAPVDYDNDEWYDKVEDTYNSCYWCKLVEDDDIADNWWPYQYDEEGNMYDLGFEEVELEDEEYNDDGHPIQYADAEADGWLNEEEILDTAVLLLTGWEQTNAGCTQQ